MHALKKQYGTDTPRLDTTFSAFLSSLERDSETHDYLTTQYADDATPSEEAFPEPVRSLLRDVPLSPTLMGNLVLQQMNLWLGRSGRGASSGLHHDFHDNLYVLLKGRKRFVLFPPESVEFFKPYGRLEKVHGNGLIVYKGPGGGDEEEGAQRDGIRADGLGKRDAAGLRVKALERKMEGLQGVEGKEDELEGLEEIYDEAVENMMDFMMDEAEGEGEDEDDDEGDDFDDEELEDDEELGAVMEKIKAQLENDSTESTKGKKRKAEDELNGHDKKATKGSNDNNGGDDFDDFDDFDEEGDGSDSDDGVGLGAFADGFDSDEASDSDDQDLKAALAKATAKTPTPAKAKPAPQEPTEPLSFSQIPTQELHQHLGLTKPQKKSPALSKAPKPLIVELKAGDMLYLPTSWWHEVTSFSEKEDEDGAKGKGGAKKDEDSIHMALNYWFHPPDRLDSFQTPYQDELVWEFMKAQVEDAYKELTQKA